MNSIAVRVFIALVAVAALCAANSSKAQKPPVAVSPPLAAAVDKGAKWLASAIATCRGPRLTARGRKHSSER